MYFKIYFKFLFLFPSLKDLQAKAQVEIIKDLSHNEAVCLESIWTSVWFGAKALLQNQVNAWCR